MAISFDTNTLASLAAKLDSLDLADDERAALHALFARAADATAEVEGYGVVFQVETTVKAGQPMGFADTEGGGIRFAADATAGRIAIGLGLDPKGWIDSMGTG